MLKPKIGHHCCDYAGSRQATLLCPTTRNQRHNLIAINSLAFFINNKDPVRVPVERLSVVRTFGSDWGLD
jgi:hypothetical protein